ncbi:unnamed protein product [Rodentolepis nana]|uniref:EGF-like domain-containing protein n=1 Tax=Rodentolepis nana TaxID=102285 RepID=A0A0R3TQR9_RODNA|nr:unnamed protein product [Rodentolepis nana]
MGDNCSIPANACNDHIRNPLLPNGGLPVAGNQACNINNDGNRCVPSVNSDIGPYFTCFCSEDRWVGDLSLSYDNCQKKVTNCDKMICIHGQCVDSLDGKEAICVCNEGYEDSPNCATFTGIWSTWSPWGHCLPACGTERWALRSRKCLSREGEHSGCHGPSIEFSACDPHACAVEEEIMVSQYFGAREVTLQAVFVLAAVSAVGLALFWRYRIYPSLAIRIRQNIQKAQEKND